MQVLWILAAWLSALLAALVGQPGGTPAAERPAAAAAPGMRAGVLTFNIRYGTAPDGENAWPKRKEQVFEILRDERVSVIGVQEALREQLDDIKQACPRLGEIGVGREDGKTDGEYSAILYRADMWKPQKSGTFWLSEMPDVPGSKSWKTACTRVCTWARLEFLGCPEDGRPCVLWFITRTWTMCLRRRG